MTPQQTLGKAVLDLKEQVAKMTPEEKENFTNIILDPKTIGALIHIISKYILEIPETDERRNPKGRAVSRRKTG